MAYFSISERKYCQSRILYPAKMPFKSEGESCGIYPRNARVIQHTKIKNIVHYINRMKGENTSTEVDAQKAFD